MAATEVGTLDILAESRKELEERDCGRMDISVATSLTDGTLVTINFSDTIGHGKQVPRSEKRNDSNCIWLHPEWRENSEDFRAKVIIPFFVGAASEAGFRINGGWDPKYNIIVFRCMRGKRNDQHKNKKASVKRRSKMNLKNPSAKPVPRNRRTQRPSKLNQAEREDPELEADSETCKHLFRIFWDDVKIRWFIPRMQAGCRRHNGHPHIEYPLLRIQPRHAVPADEIDVAESVRTSAMGGNSFVHHGSDCMVPSQLIQQQASDSEPVEAQGNDAKADFLPVFETICKFTNDAGPEGRCVLEQELNALRDEQLAIIAKKKEPTSGKDAYSEYMHLYESVCGYTNDAGEEGRRALMEGLNRLKKKQVDIITQQKCVSTGGVASMPAVSTKTIYI